MLTKGGKKQKVKGMEKIESNRDMQRETRSHHYLFVC